MARNRAKKLAHALIWPAAVRHRAAQTLTSEPRAEPSQRELTLQKPAESPRQLELLISIVRNTLRIVFCGDKASAFVALTVQIASRYLAVMQIVTLDLRECSNGSAISGFSLQIWPGWKWITGLSDLVAQ